MNIRIETRQTGFSLVEMMIAAALGLFILAGISTVYLNARDLFRIQDSLSKMQENGRFAMELMQRQIRMAGFTGCNSTAVTPVNTLNNPAAYAYDFTVGIQGYDATGTSWSPALDASISGANPAPAPGHDVVTIRAVSGSSFNLTPPYMNTNAAALHVEAGNTLNQFDILMVTDCSAAAIFQLSNAEPQTSGTVDHNTGVGTPGNSTKNLGKSFGADATVQTINTSSYYIAPSAISAVSGTNSLWRRVGVNAPEELAEGVDDLQILYGVDLDGDNSANSYVTANSVTDWRRVVAVKLSLVLRTVTDNVATSSQTAYSSIYRAATTSSPVSSVTLNPPDRRLRAVFSTVITLRNRVS